ncbi:MAG: hypothetical protein HKM94_05435 [Halobacteria archaeon]|nr:hypothetical protein [Halobacteria archaeon]
MAITHKFKDANDFTQGGEWFDDNGRRICEWGWDGGAKKLNIKCGIHVRRIDLSKSERQNLTDKNLNRSLPMLALETAEEINNIKYDL